MGRLPNHRFSLARQRTVSPVEATLDFVKYRLASAFVKTQTDTPGFGSLGRSLPEAQYIMGNKKKDRAEDFGSGDESRKSVPSPRPSNPKKGARAAVTGATPVKNIVASIEQHDDPPPEEREVNERADTQSEIEFEPYFGVVDDFTAHLMTVHKSMKKVEAFYAKQKHDIRNAVQTKEKYKDLTIKYRRLASAVEMLRELEKEKDERLDSELAKVKEERESLEKSLNEAAEGLKKLESDREAFEKKVKEDKKAFEKKVKEDKEAFEKKVTEDKEAFEKMVKDHEAEFKEMVETQKKENTAAQEIKLAELEKAQSEKLAELEKDQEQAHQARMETLERETKERRDADEAIMSEQRAKHEKLQEDFDEQQAKLKEVERKCRLAERLNDVSDEAMERLKQSLKRAENEFELNTFSTEHYQREFAKIETTTREIAERNIKELHITDLDSVHEQLETVDKNFESVPISGSEVSLKLCTAHMQRIMASQLREVIFQPFSSDLILQDKEQTAHLNQIATELANSSHGTSSGPRAARLYTALTMRSLHTQCPSSVQRAEFFTDSVMSVVSLMVEDSLHESLRSELNELATSAATLWTTAQLDERDIVVHFDIQPTGFEGWHADLPAPNQIIVLFPRITARKYHCPWTVNKPSTDVVSDAFIDSEPVPNFEENSIYDGHGLPEWSDLVAEGEEEEEERKAERERQEVEEQRKEFEEKLKRRLSETMRHKRRISSNRRESFTGSTNSPSGMWHSAGSNLIIAEAAA